MQALEKKWFPSYPLPQLRCCGNGAQTNFRRRSDGPEGRGSSMILTRHDKSEMEKDV